MEVDKSGGAESINEPPTSEPDYEPVGDDDDDLPF